MPRTRSRSRSRCRRSCAAEYRGSRRSARRGALAVSTARKCGAPTRSSNAPGEWPLRIVPRVHAARAHVAPPGRAACAPATYSTCCRPTAASRRAHRRLSAGTATLRGPRRRLRHHAGAVDGAQRCWHPALRRACIALLRQTGTARVMCLEELLALKDRHLGAPVAAFPHEPRAAGSRALQRPTRRGHGCAASPRALFRSAGGSRVFHLRPRRHDRAGHRDAARARGRAPSASMRSISRWPSTDGGDAPRAAARRRASARGWPAWRRSRCSWTAGGARFTMKMDERDGARCGGARRHRAAVFVPCRRVLDLPHQGRARRGRDGAELRARGLGARAGLRARLPVARASARRSNWITTRMRAAGCRTRG